MSYRMDNRSKDQFKKDIKLSKDIEIDIIKRWVGTLEHSTGKPVEWKDNAIGANGEFLEEDEVTTEADYWVSGYGLLEVKFSKPALKQVFHLKVSQCHSYIKQNCCILMVDAYETDSSKWAIIWPSQLQEISKSCEVVNFRGLGFKPCYRVPLETLKWRVFSE